MNTRLYKMLCEGRIAARGQWIDCYNQSTSEIAGTIIAGINTKNEHFIMETYETDTRDIRDDSVQVVGELHPGQNGVVYNPESVAPTITASKGVKVHTKIAEPIVLGWSRDEKGNVINRHPVEVANAVTAAKRDNTQNYVIEQRGRGFNKGGTHDIAPTISSHSYEHNNHVVNIDGKAC